ncbi:MAG: apolipoprotein N-acyltransferase [Candidatus Omnitrophica bacterium]|nr:apolipoprotein N-acyltransferase [Candidatus Omnitrophota bacterium]
MRLKNFFLTILSCILFVLGLYLPPARPLSYFAFIPLFCIYLDEKTKTFKLFQYIVLAGLVYYANALQWLVLFNYGIYAGAVLISTLIFGIYFVLLRWLAGNSKNLIPHTGMAFFIWFVLQAALDYTPLSSASIDIPFYGSQPFYQLCAIQGFGLVSGLIMAVNLSVAALAVKRSKSSIFLALLSLLVLAGGFVWGTRQIQNPPISQESIRVALIQHNLPADGKWRFEHAKTIEDTYKRLTQYAATPDTDLIVFPLYSIPEDPLRNRLFFASLARRARKYILFASHVPKEPGGDILTGPYMNMAFLISPEGSLWGPYQSSIASPGNLLRESTAEKYQIIESPLGKIGVLLCFENAHPRLARQAVRQGADILISLSNPGRLTAPMLTEHHLTLDQLRSIETGRWTARVSPNGYTAVVDPSGTVVEKTELGKEQVLRFDLPKAKLQALYPQHPFLMVIAAYLFIVIMVLGKFLTKKGTKENHRQEGHQKPQKQVSEKA